ncbi:MAG: hypothetical protein AB7Q17_18195, partial [Phycisphaerae bacterium]
MTGLFGAVAFAQVATPPAVKPVDPTPQAGYVEPTKGEVTTVKELLPAWTGDDGGIAGPGNDPCATPAVLVGDSGSAATDTTTATN